MTPNVICPYCKQPAELHESSAAFYHGNNFGPVWRCGPCKAMVGCHKNSDRFAPLGLLAKNEDRKLRIAAHEVFDRLWTDRLKSKASRGNARQIAYHWLAFELGINPDNCHIAMFNSKTCRKVISLCERKMTEVKHDTDKTP
jgi:hypothetical protein